MRDVAQAIEASRSWQHRKLVTAAMKADAVIAVQLYHKLEI